MQIFQRSKKPPANRQCSSGLTYRDALQLDCSASLPVVTANVVNHPDLHQVTDPSVVVVSTEISGTPELDVGGILQDVTKLATKTYSVEGTAVGAMTSYLTSKDYAEHPASFLVWHLPVWQMFGNFGDQPFRELQAAAAQNCGVPVALTKNEGGQYVADASALNLTSDHTLLLATGSQTARSAEFTFADKSGLKLTRRIFRRDEQPPTSQFYMPVTGLVLASLVMLRCPSMANSPKKRPCSSARHHHEPLLFYARLDHARNCLGSICACRTPDIGHIAT